MKPIEDRDCQKIYQNQETLEGEMKPVKTAAKIRRNWWKKRVLNRRNGQKEQECMEKQDKRRIHPNSTPLMAK